MKATYKNALKSKELIKDAVFSLLQCKHLTEISICDVVKTAKVNRGTFYNHFSGVKQVLNEATAELMAKLAHDLKVGYANNNFNYFFNATIQHIKENEQSYKNLTIALPRSVFYNMKMELINQLKLLPEDLPTQKVFFVINGFTGSVLDFLEGQTSLSLEQIASEAINYINSCK